MIMTPKTNHTSSPLPSQHLSPSKFSLYEKVPRDHKLSASSTTSIISPPMKNLTQQQSHYLPQQADLRPKCLCWKFSRVRFSRRIVGGIWELLLPRGGFWCFIQGGKLRGVGFVGFERGRFWGFFWFAFLLEVGGFFRFVGLGDWGDCGYFKRTMGFLGRVGEESGRVGLWWGGGQGRGRRRSKGRGV